MQYFLNSYFFIFIGQPKGLCTNLITLPLIVPFLKKIQPKNQDHEFIFLPKQSNTNQLVISQIKLNQIFNHFALSKIPKNSQLFLAPESFLEIKNTEMLKLIGKYLPKNSLIISGCHQLDFDSNKNYQNILVIKQPQPLLLQKNLLCPWYEEAFFHQPQNPSYKARSFLFKNKNYLILMCSEFFLAPTTNNWPKHDNLILLVNQKAFPVFFYKMLLSSAIMFSLIHQKKIIWVDYYGLRIINFSGRVPTVTSLATKGLLWLEKLVTFL